MINDSYFYLFFDIMYYIPYTRVIFSSLSLSLSLSRTICYLAVVFAFKRCFRWFGGRAMLC